MVVMILLRKIKTQIFHSNDDVSQKHIFMLSKNMYKNVHGPREISLAISSRMHKNKIVVYLFNGIIKKVRISRSQLQAIQII